MPSLIPKTDAVTEIVIAGPKIHGILFAGQILAQAAVFQGLDVKTAEFSNEPMMSLELCHVRIGEKVYSPLVAQKKGNFIICSDVRFLGSVKGYLAPEGILITNDFSDIAEKTGKMACLVFILVGYLSKFQDFPLTPSCLTESAKITLASAENDLFLRSFQKGRDIPFPAE